MLPKKLKVYPFFNNSNKPVSTNKRSFLFKRYVQSKYSNNRNLHAKSNLQSRSLNSSRNKCWKKDLFLWQNTKPFVRLLDRLIQIKKNKKDGSKVVLKKSLFFENDQLMKNEEKLEIQNKNDFNTLKNEIKKDIFRFSKLTKKNKKSIHDFKSDLSLDNRSELSSFLTSVSKKENYQILIRWVFYNLYLQSKKKRNSD